MTAAEESLQRAHHIEPRVEELWARVQNGARGPRPSAVQLGMAEIPIEAWEWDALVAWTKAPGARDVKSWHVLIAEGIALQAKAFDDLDRVASQPGVDDEARGAAFSDLDFDALTAFKLLREVQRTIEQMIVKGRIDQAKKLTQFRRRLLDTTAAIGRILGESALKEIEDLADASPWVPAAHFDATAAEAKEGDAAAEAEPTDEGPEAGPDAKGGPARRAKPSDEERLKALIALEEELHRAEKSSGMPFAVTEPTDTDLESLGVRAKKRSYTARIVLMAMLAVTCVSWALLTLRQRTAETKPLPALALADFAGQRGVTGIVARPPSLYVTVDADAWAEMGLLERQQLVEAIGAKLAPAGYFGAHLIDSQGNAVARWLKESGVRIFEASAKAS